MYCTKLVMINTQKVFLVELVKPHSERGNLDLYNIQRETSYAGFHKIFREGGGNHLTPPTYQETVPITNALNTPLEKILGVFEQLNTFLLQQMSLCCCLCHLVLI